MGGCVIDWGPGYRIYLAKDGETLIVLSPTGNASMDKLAAILRVLRACLNVNLGAHSVAA
jgi:putative component of toxin-antitoxin plasmid stabilization module